MQFLPSPGSRAPKGVFRLKANVQTEPAGVTIVFAEITQGSFDVRLSINRVFSVRPIVCSTYAETTPEPLVPAGECHACHIGSGLRQGVIIEIGNAISVDPIDGDLLTGFK